MEYQLIIFDKDGTLCEAISGDPFINSADDQRLMPKREETLNSLRRANVKIGIASNQGGVAYGFMSLEEAADIIEHAAELAKADVWAFSPYHPDGTVEKYAIEHFSRKPQPGMLLQLMLEAETWPFFTLFVGDREEDEEAARRAGIDFMWAEEFFDG